MTLAKRVLWVVGLSKGWSCEVVIELKSYEAIGKRYAREVTARLWWVGIMKIAVIGSPEILDRPIILKRHDSTPKTATFTHRTMEDPTTRQRHSWGPFYTLKREIL